MAYDHNCILGNHLNMGYPLLQGASVQKVVRCPNLMNAAILFPVEGGLKEVFEPQGFKPGGLFSITLTKPYGIH